MADRKLIDIGSFEVEKAIMKDASGSKELNIAMLITEIMINESIYAQYVGVNLMIYDTFALTDEFPIVGEETIDIVYKDYFDKTMEMSLHVVGIDEVATDDKSESQSYILRCMTTDFIVSETTRIQQSFTGSVSQIAKTVYDEYFKNKELDLEETDGERKFVIPSYTPVETMLFLAKKANSMTNKSSNFLFFENREKFFFKTHEQILKDAAELPERNTFHYGENNMDVTERKVLMNHAISLKPRKRFDLISTFRTGAALTEVIRIDPATRSFTPEIYDHGDEFDSFEHMDPKSKNYHSQEFRDKYLSKENNVVNTFMTFEESNEDEKYYSEIIPRRNSTSFYLKGNIVEMEIHGCNDIFAGSIINLEIPEMKFINGEKKTHPNLAGRYMVESIQHTMAEKQWKMRLRMVKDSFVDG